MQDDQISNIIKNPSSSAVVVTGSGSFSSVYLTNVPGIVVKAIRKPWDPAALYYILCLEQKKEWMPKVYGITYDVEEALIYVIMEQLSETNSMGTPRPRTCGSYDELEDYIREKMYEYLISNDEVNEIISMYHDIQSMVSMVPGNEIYIDAHPANWMYRGDKLVLTDPVVVNDWRDFSNYCDNGIALAKNFYNWAKGVDGINIIEGEKAA